MNGSTAPARKKMTHTQRELSLTHKANSQGSNRKPRNLPRIVRPRCPRGQTPTSTTPGETRQGGVKRSGTEAPRSHQLPLKWNFRTKGREKPTHLKEKTNKNCLVCTTQPKDDSSLAGLFRETGGWWGPHPRAPAPVTRRLCTWLSCLQEE